MQVIQSQAEMRNVLNGAFHWFSHNAVWIGGIVLAFFLGMAVNNGDATRSAIASVQTTYQGKLVYHLQHEKVLAKTVEKAMVACKHNAYVAIDNAAPSKEINRCPPAPTAP